MRRFLTFIIAGFVTLLSLPTSASALSGADWQAGRIIDDNVFFNGRTMTAHEVQLFLNSKVPVCDTNGTQPFGGETRASYSTNAGYPPPFTCLKDYRQDTPARSPEAGLCGQYSGGNKSAAEIIYEVGVACDINPKALIVLLQKEQALVTDDWPWSIQYRSATGYGCPDTAACDAQYYGFFNQVYNAARQFRLYARDSSQYRYRSNRNNFIQFHPNAACGGSEVYIQNQATAGLYNYTPYQPNAVSLSNLSGGQSDGCSSYGNRNFWRLFNEWFGSVNGAAYSWQLVSVEFYSDAARTQRFSFEPTVQAGVTAYARIKAVNTGYLTWEPSFIRLGTSNPRDHHSPFRDSSWLYPTRAAQLKESRVEPSQVGTFEFSITAPATSGAYREYFNLVAEGSTWLNDLGAYYSFNVVSPTTIPDAPSAVLNPGQTLDVRNYLIAPLGQASLSLQPDGRLSLSHNYQPRWQTNAAGSEPRHLVMQHDGNLVLYNINNQPLWFTGTGGNPGARLVLQVDGNLVLYSNGGVPLWSTQTIHNPSYQYYVNPILYPGKLLRGQWLETADRRYRMVLQNDGNLVLYSPERALWTTQTNGSSAAYLAMQPDGNLVLYNSSDQPIWQSGTSDRGITALVLQQDGNLVTYQGMAVPTWDTRTGGQ